MKVDFFAGWRAYMAAQPLDLNKDRNWKSGWRAAEIKHRNTPAERPRLKPIPRVKEDL